MGPITLFDKSFLQALTVDESVWFSHFFLPVVCPLFYIETLADLQKATRPGRTPEDEVRIIADKFPDMGGAPVTFHAQMIPSELMGHRVPLDGRIPVSGGRTVRLGDKTGVVQPMTPEQEAFQRWATGEFHEIERRAAQYWRAMLGATDLNASAEFVRRLGINPTTCKSLEDAHQLAVNAITNRENPHQRLDLVLRLFPVDRRTEHAIRERYNIAGYPALRDYAPYTAHCVSVWLFFHFALAAALIGTSRASNHIDILYLFYLPFCSVFVSSDSLHRRTAPLFLREDQEFVWGPELKADLTRINSHFAALPETERDKGLGHFAHAPPPSQTCTVRRLRRRFLSEGYDDKPPVQQPRNPERDAKLLREVEMWGDAPYSPVHVKDTEDLDTFTIERTVRRKRGSWYQVPKDLPDQPPRNRRR